MTAMEETSDNIIDNGFIGDVKTYVLQLLAGLLPLLTLVPLFINKTHNILGVSYEIGFWIFSILYIILPILISFSWIWYCIAQRSRLRKTQPPGPGPAGHEMVLRQDVLKYSYFIALGIILILVFIFHFVFRSVLFCLFNFFMLLLALAVMLLLVRSMRAYRKTIKGIIDKEPARGISQKILADGVAGGRVDSLSKLHIGLLQFCILFGLVFYFLISFMIRNDNKRIPDEVRSGPGTFSKPDIADSYLDVHQYIDALEIEQDSVKSYPKMLKEMKDSIDLLFFEMGLAGVSRGKLTLLDSQVIDQHYNQCYYTGAEASNRLVLLLDSVYELAPEMIFRLGRDSSHELFREKYIFDRLYRAIEREKRSMLDAVIAARQLAERFSGCDYWHYKMREVGYTSSFNAGNLGRFTNDFQQRLENSTKREWSIFLHRVKLYVLGIFGIYLLWLLTLWWYYYIHQVHKDYFDKPSVGMGSIANILSAAKASVTIIFLLSIPFFRSVAPENIDLNSPFLHFSLSNLVQGGSDAPVPPPVSSINVNVDTLLQNYYGGPVNNYNDSAGMIILKEHWRLIERKIDSLMKRTNGAGAGDLKGELDEIKRKVNYIEPDTLIVNNKK